MGAGTGQTMARITTAWRRAEVVVEAIFFNSKKSQVDEGRKKNRRAAALRPQTSEARRQPASPSPSGRSYGTRI